MSEDLAEEGHMLVKELNKRSEKLQKSKGKQDQVSDNLKKKGGKYGR